MDTFNAIADSNRVLREERDRLLERVSTLEQQLAKIEVEVVSSYKEKVGKLSSHVDQMSTENTALKAEAARWLLDIGVGFCLQYVSSNFIFSM